MHHFWGGERSLERKSCRAASLATIFFEEPSLPVNYSKLKIKSYIHWDLYLHENQCYLGRVFLLLPERKGIEDFLDLENDVRNEFFQVGNELKTALKTLFQPDKFNYAALSNISEEIHVHIVPRYKAARSFCETAFEDARWGQNYAPYDRNFHLPESLILSIRQAIAIHL